jgi:purine-binding chemotaxis protein CheW
MEQHRTSLTRQPAGPVGPADAGRAGPGRVGVSAAGQYITFTIGREEYGVDVLAVREIRAWTPETRLPNMPDHVRGVINLRGVIIPIFDLRARFGGGRTDPTRRHVVIVMQVGSRVQGILTDAISDILAADSSELRPAPETDSTLIDQRCILGLVTRDERMVAILDVERLLSASLTASPAQLTDAIEE